MINWFDMPAEGLSGGGQFEIKELNVTENGEYETDGEVYNKVTVNVEGGGGSSDFSTAEVTFLFTGLPEGVTPFLYNPFIGINIGTDDNPDIWAIPEYGSRSYGDGICTTILYKGTALMAAGVASVTGSDNNFYVRDYENPVTLSGAIEEYGDDFIITGDCSITVPLVAE